MLGCSTVTVHKTRISRAVVKVQRASFTLAFPFIALVNIHEFGARQERRTSQKVLLSARGFFVFLPSPSVSLVSNATPKTRRANEIYERFIGSTSPRHEAGALRVFSCRAFLTFYHLLFFLLSRPILTWSKSKQLHVMRSLISVARLRHRPPICECALDLGRLEGLPYLPRLAAGRLRKH